jgi:hypothetical protein
LYGRTSATVSTYGEIDADAGAATHAETTNTAANTALLNAMTHPSPSSCAVSVVAGCRTSHEYHVLILISENAATGSHRRLQRQTRRGLATAEIPPLPAIAAENLGT